jgi:large subunit ribosomal protein L18
MATKPKTVLYRRKRQKKTDYKKRLKLLIGDKPRIVVRFTNQRVIVQLVEFHPAGDKVLLALDSLALKKLGWEYSCKNLSAAYLTGLLFGKKAKEQNQEAILDTGVAYTIKGGKFFAFLKGLLDSGLEVPHGEGIFPKDDRLSGSHIKKYAESLKSNTGAYKARFAKYLKSKGGPEGLTEQFVQMKKKILG